MTDQLAPLRSVLDEAFADYEDTAVIDLEPITERFTAVATWTPPRRTAGWTPPPIVLPDFCGHRDEIGYEHAMAEAADWRRAADEIRAHREAVYPHLGKPARKRRSTEEGDVIADLSDARRDNKPWLPADDRDVTNGLVIEDSWGLPACVLHGSMNRVDRVNRFFRCSEFRCGVGAQVVRAT